MWALPKNFSWQHNCRTQNSCENDVDIPVSKCCRPIVERWDTVSLPQSVVEWTAIRSWPKESCWSPNFLLACCTWQRKIRCSSSWSPFHVDGEERSVVLASCVTSNSSVVFKQYFWRRSLCFLGGEKYLVVRVDFVVPGWLDSPHLVVWWLVGVCACRLLLFLS